MWYELSFYHDIHLANHNRSVQNALINQLNFITTHRRVYITNHTKSTISNRELTRAQQREKRYRQQPHPVGFHHAAARHARSSRHWSVFWASAQHNPLPPAHAVDCRPAGLAAAARRRCSGEWEPSRAPANQRASWRRLWPATDRPRWRRHAPRGDETPPPDSHVTAARRPADMSRDAMGWDDRVIGLRIGVGNVGSVLNPVTPSRPKLCAMWRYGWLFISSLHVLIIVAFRFYTCAMSSWLDKAHQMNLSASNMGLVPIFLPKMLEYEIINR